MPVCDHCMQWLIINKMLRKSMVCSMVLQFRGRKCQVVNAGTGCGFTLYYPECKYNINKYETDILDLIIGLTK